MRTDAASRKQRCLELLAEGLPPSAAAERLGVTLRTVRRYLADPASRDALRTLRDERLHALGRRALTEADPALGVLRAVSDDATAPPAARVSAAKALLDVAVRLTQDVDLAERVAALEESLGGKDGARK